MTEADDITGTGDARVDEAVARLGELEGAPLDEHPVILGEIHDRLRGVLGELGPDAPSTPSTPDAPSAPDAPSTPDAPQAPDMPNGPGSRGTP